MLALLDDLIAMNSKGGSMHSGHQIGTKRSRSADDMVGVG